jgi:hypothetical protein
MKISCISGLPFLPVLFFGCGNAVAADFSEALSRDSKLNLQLRSFYLERNKSNAADSESWAGGGWLEYRSGWAYDRLGIGLTQYTSQKIYGPADKDGAALLANGQQSYSVLGEAFVKLKVNEQVVSVGRFLLDTHEENPQDSRMSPRTFEGATLAGKFGIVEYIAGYVTKMKQRNSDDFVNVATVAGAPDAVREPKLSISAHFKPSEDLIFSLSSYRIKDVLTSTYLDASHTLPLGDDAKLRLNAQYMYQSSTGDNLLTGSYFSTDSAGFKVDWLQGPFTLSGILMKTDSGAAYRTPFGSWQGYTCRMITNFNRAGEQVRAIDLGLSFEGMGIKGLSANSSVTYGDHAINAATGDALAKNTEYNFSAEYRFTDIGWPHLLQPLHIKVSSGFLKQSLDGATETVTENRLVFNYRAELK